MTRLKTISFLTITAVLISNVAFAGEAGQPTLSEQQRDTRFQHARELLGSHYKHSAVRNGEQVKKINSRIYSWTRERLPKKIPQRLSENRTSHYR